MLELVQNKRILELGAGVGLLSVVTQQLSQSDYYATDLDMGVLSRLEANAELSG